MAMRIAALAGGVGGAKLADGLAHCLEPNELAIIVNTGDDFNHLGLAISPDLDTVLYTLAGVANTETGWGRSGETWGALDVVGELGGPTWFRLGDHDLGLHLERTRRLGLGEPLSKITADFARRLGVENPIFPMSDDPVRTFVETTDGRLAFQEYFVKLSCQPVVNSFEFTHVSQADPAPGVIDAIIGADVIIFCPSNPWVSLDPILSIPAIGEAVHTKQVIGISPIIAGKALRGPAARMYQQLGIEPSALAVASHFRSYLSGFVIDHADDSLAAGIETLGIKVLVLDAVMHDEQDRERLAREILMFAEQFLQSERSG